MRLLIGYSTCQSCPVAPPRCETGETHSSLVRLRGCAAHAQYDSGRGNADPGCEWICWSSLTGRKKRRREALLGNRAPSLRWGRSLYCGFIVSLAISEWKMGFKCTVCVLLRISRLARGGSAVTQSSSGLFTHFFFFMKCKYSILSLRNDEFACSRSFWSLVKLTAVLWLCITEIHMSAFNLTFNLTFKKKNIIIIHDFMLLLYFFLNHMKQFGNDS